MSAKVAPTEAAASGQGPAARRSTWLRRALFRLDAVTSFTTLTMMRSLLRAYAESRAARGVVVPEWAQDLALAVVLPPLFAAWFLRRWVRLLLGAFAAARRTVALVTQIALAGRATSLLYVGGLVAFHYFDEATDAMVIWSWCAALRAGDRAYVSGVFKSLPPPARTTPAR